VSKSPPSDTRQFWGEVERAFPGSNKNRVVFNIQSLAVEHGLDLSCYTVVQRTDGVWQLVPRSWDLPGHCYPFATTAELDRRAKEGGLL
jgi:hypothetical protein